MMSYIQQLLSSAQFVPHGVCLLWRPDLIIMHGVSDLMIAVAYLTIPVVIIKAVKARPDLIDPQVAKLFAAFITACALSHLSSLLTLWVPAYGLQGIIKMATAFVSVYTALQLAKLLPLFLQLPSKEELALKEAEVVLQQRQMQEAREQQDRLSEFAHIVSHDLKSPLRGIVNQSNFIREDHATNLPEDVLKRLARISDLAQNLGELIDTVLQYSKVGRDRHLKNVNTGTAVDHVVDSLREAIEEKNAQVSVNNELPVVVGDRSEINIVFRNLITNALKYNHSKQPRINVEFHPTLVVEGREVHNVFSVSDNGIGIAPQHHDEVFRMFKRLNPTDLFSEGTGAGLAFVSKIVKSRGGDVTISSDGASGTTVYFWFNSPADALLPSNTTSGQVQNVPT